jgi:pilus assembly protein CpaB
MHNLREDLSFNAVTTDPNESWWRSGVKGGMRGKIAIALLFSVASGGYAASLTSTWLDGQRSRYELAQVKPEAPAPIMQKIVVASQSVKHGEELTARNTKLIDWAADELPPSAFSAKDMLFASQGKRFALAAMEPNEPILGSKITAPGKSASLSAELAPGKKAVTIRVDDVLGVGGLIVPNDRVDILWTSKPQGDESKKEPFTAMLIPGVRVLALDQTVNENSSKARVARAITVEVDTRQAQKVALGSQTGKLHLALRSYGAEENDNVSFQRVSLSNLGSNSFFGGIKTVPVPRSLTIPAALTMPVKTQEYKFDPNDITASTSKPGQPKHSSEVTITRGLVKEKYEVVSSTSS